jgi:hypothetical protein
MIGSAKNSNPFVSGAAPTIAYLLWTALWFAAVAAMGIAFFSRRDI